MDRIYGWGVIDCDGYSVKEVVKKTAAEAEIVAEKLSNSIYRTFAPYTVVELFYKTPD